jgi:arginase
MPVDLITVPFDAGRRGKRMGAGPQHFVRHGAEARLKAVAGRVRLTDIGSQAAFRTEIATSFELARGIAFAVRAARGRGSFPLVLAGNCIASLGVLAALPSAGTGVVWLDAHGDLNTPETTSSGMLDGMALAVATGRCWTTLAASIDGFEPISDDRVLLAGARSLDTPELRLLESSPMLHARPAQVRGRGEGKPFRELLDTLARRVARVYLHVDLDVHDPREGHANEFHAPGGLTASEVREVIRDVAGRIPIAAAAITAYDPVEDRDDRILTIGLELMELIAKLAASPDAQP